MQQAHLRPGRMHQVQPGGDNGGSQPLVQGAAVLAQLQHVGQHDDAAAAGPHRLGAQADEARLHRQRIGVVALVDQGEGAAGHSDRPLLPAPGQRLKARQRLQRRLQRHVQRLQHQDDAQAVQPPVHARLGQPVFEAPPVQLGRDGRALAVGHEVQQARVAARFMAEGPHHGPSLSRPLTHDVGMGVGGVDHGDPARRQPLEDGGLFTRHARLAVGEGFDVHRPDRGDAGGVRAHELRQRPDLARMVHADLEHGAIRALRHARQRQRHADVVVVALDRGVA